MTDDNHKDSDNDYRAMSKYLGLLAKIGGVMCGSILLCFGLGLVAINQFDWPRPILVIFVFFGIFCGFYFVYREITRL